MKLERLKNQPVIIKGEIHTTIVDVSDDDLEHTILTMANGKAYSLYVAFKRGTLYFQDDSLRSLIEIMIANHDEDTAAAEAEEQRQMARRSQEAIRTAPSFYDRSITTFREDNYFLSNMYECPVQYDGKTYRCAEAAFQAQKDLTRRDEFTTLTGRQAKSLGKKVELRKDWEAIKVGIMTDIVRCKFTQNPDLREKLLNTMDCYLEEGNTWNDTFWGVCRGRGRNTLGKILMIIRDELAK